MMCPMFSSFKPIDILVASIFVRAGLTLFDGEFEAFLNLPRGCEAVARTNTPGYKVPGDISILESILHSLSESEGVVIDMLGKMTKYEKDGNGGELIVRNMARAMQCWDTERVLRASFTSPGLRSLEPWLSRKVTNTAN